MTAAFALATAATFNLACSGSMTAGVLFDFKDQQKSEFRIEFRIDLNQKRWCSGACETTAPLAEVTDQYIMFVREEREGFDSLMIVNRENGAFTDRTRDFQIRWITVRIGKCERAEFTGFPTRKF